MTIEELSNKYIELARENVNVKKIFPPNRYIFTTKYFRSIKGWDEEWYKIMYGWMDILKSKGWKEYWYDRDAGESMFCNFQYLYDLELPSCSASFNIKDINKIVQWTELNGEKCHQTALDSEEYYKLSNPVSQPIHFNDFIFIKN